DRRDRGARSQPPPRPGAPRPSRDVRRNARQLHDCDDRRLSAVKTFNARDAKDADWMTYYGRVKEAADAVRSRIRGVPDVAIVLGSGLGDFANTLTDAVAMPYDTLPNWPASRVIGHEGRVVVGRARGKTVAALAGRVHLYEGHDVQTVTFAVRALGL